MPLRLYSWDRLNQWQDSRNRESDHRENSPIRAGFSAKKSCFLMLTGPGLGKKPIFKIKKKMEIFQFSSFLCLRQKTAHSVFCNCEECFTEAPLLLCQFFCYSCCESFLFLLFFHVNVSGFEQASVFMIMNLWLWL